MKVEGMEVGDLVDKAPLLRVPAGAFEPTPGLNEFVRPFGMHSTCTQLSMSGKAERYHQDARKSHN